MERYKIPDSEFVRRWETLKKKIKQNKFDAFIAYSNEADFANVRYLSDYWPIFESAGVLVPAEGEPALLIGPESETFARDTSRIKKIYKMIEFRESAEPEYPGLMLDSFEVIFRQMKLKKSAKICIASSQIFPLCVFESIKKALPAAKFGKGDEIINSMRAIKTDIELKILKEAFRISEITLEKTVKNIKAGLTELQVVGLIQKELYQHGAEYEGHPQYVLAGKNSTHAIGRPSYSKIKNNQIIQLNIGARVAGYSSSVGRPICIGKMSEEAKKLVQTGLELHYKTIDWLKPGIMASKIAKDFFEYADTLGVKKNILYGPCHGLGMMEVEKPWMETHSNYFLEENMTFQVDTFLYCRDYGIRWENGVIIKKHGAELLSDSLMKIIEL